MWQLTSNLHIFLTIIKKITATVGHRHWHKKTYSFNSPNLISYKKCSSKLLITKHQTNFLWKNISSLKIYVDLAYRMGKMPHYFSFHQKRHVICIESASPRQCSRRDVAFWGSIRSYGALERFVLADIQDHKLSAPLASTGIYGFCTILSLILIDTGIWNILFSLNLMSNWIFVISLHADPYNLTQPWGNWTQNAVLPLVLT